MNVVAHNIAAMNASRQLNIVAKAKQKTSEKLSSGYRINRAADDAAGLSISEKMRAQIRGLNQGAENIEHGISFVQVADGALEEVSSMLQRINELAVQSANGTNSQSERNAIDNEVQQLKTEMERVFTTTTFNQKKIWDEDAILVTPVEVGVKEVQAVKIITPSSQTIKIDNESYDKIACGGYYISADTTGVTVSWTDYDGVEHETDAITWDELEANDYSFQIADYFNPADDLWDGADPVFDFEISFKVEPEAEVADIIASINNTSMTGTSSVWMRGAFEDGLNIQGVSVNSASLNYAAAYASRENAATTGYDFEASSDTFLEATVTNTDGNLDAIPENNSTSVSVANQSDDTWSFTFDMEGIGRVTATSDQIHYYSPDSSAEAENVWWRWEKRTDGTRYRATIHRYPSEQGAGTLGTLMSTLTGSANTSTPGLLSKTTQKRTLLQLSLQFVMRIWQKRWCSSRRKISCSRQDRLCWRRQTRIHREYLVYCNNAMRKEE